VTRLAVIGAGVMGEALVSGLLKAGWSSDDLVVADRRDFRRAEMTAAHGVRATGNAEAAAEADTVILVVKPQDVGAVLPEIAPVLKPGTLVVSLCAGVTTATLESHLPAGAAVVRVMPNTPALVGEGMAAVSGGGSASEDDVTHALELMSALGKAIMVPESYQDAVTAISGSGPAYLFFVVEAMIDAGVMLGLPRDIATTLVNQTMFGSAKLLVESGAHPTVLREQVTSPGGTTAAALRQLEDHKVKAAFITAIEAARDRSRALAGPPSRLSRTRHERRRHIRAGSCAPPPRRVWCRTHQPPKGVRRTADNPEKSPDERSRTRARTTVGDQVPEGHGGGDHVAGVANVGLPIDSLRGS